MKLATKGISSRTEGDCRTGKSLSTAIGRTAFGIAALSLLVVAPARAILIDNSWNLADSRALATDFANFPAFQATGLVEVTEGMNNFDATGVLIASDWVLTAAHNWNNANVTNLTFTVGGTLYNGNLAQRFQHPNWNASPAPLMNAAVGISQGWDIALFRLTAPVAGIAPAQLYAGTNELNSQVYTLGFGNTGTGTAPAMPPAVRGSIHAISNTIDRVTSQTAGGFSGGQLFYDFDSGAAGGNTLATAGLPDNDAFSTTLNPAGTIFGTTSTTTQIMRDTSIIEGGTAQGDSGGPTFIFDGGAWKVAGITSWGINPANNFGNTGLYGDVTAVTRVSEHITWINSIIVPEPGAGAMMMTAVFLLGIVWRRRPSLRWQGC
jgi:Trypsin